MGVPTILAGVSLFLASGLLIVFFATESEAADKAANWFFLVFYALMAWTVVEVHDVYVDDFGPVWVLTIGALVALVLLFVTTLLVVLGRLDFRRIAIATTVAFLVVLLWMLGISVLIVTEDHLPNALGWLGIGVIAAAVLVVGVTATDRELVMGEKTPPPALNAVYGLILVGLTAWLVWLGAAPLAS